MVVVVVVLEVFAGHWLLDDWKVGVSLLFLVSLALHEELNAFFDVPASALDVLHVASCLTRVHSFPAAVS